jgi:hypothetical protein
MYRIEIVHRPGKSYTNTDSLSRMPREPSSDVPPADIVLSNSRIVILQTGLIEMLYIQAFLI